MGQAVTQPRQGDTWDVDPLPTSFSLERAQQKSSNPLLTAARYHSTLRGARGRRLHDDFEAFPGPAVLGRGTTGEVAAVLGRLDRRRYALKSFFKPMLSKEDLGLMVNEVELHLGLDHPHIACLRAVYETDDDLHMVMECCDGGELYERLRRDGALSEAEAASSVRQLLRALGHLHARGLVHRDLKLENILYESMGYASPLKLVDFGLAWAWDPAGPSMRRCCGSPEYVSPEVLVGRGYTSKCDLWSIGVVAFMLLAGRAPFPRAAANPRTVVQGAVDWGPEERWAEVSPDARDFIARLLVVAPEQRLDARQAMFHPWLLRVLGSHVRTPPVPWPKALRSLQAYAAGPRVRRVGLQLLSQHVLLQDLPQMREAFLGLDVNNEGRLVARDVQEALCGAERLASADLRELLAALDAIGGESGVCFSEFAAAASQVVTRDLALTVFDRLDSGGKGFIDAGDLAAVLGPKISAEAVVGGAEGLPLEDPLSELAFAGRLSFEAFFSLLKAEGEPDSPQGGSPLSGILSAARAALWGRTVAAA